jgi:hypothetical protein
VVVLKGNLVRFDHRGRDCGRRAFDEAFGPDDRRVNVACGHCMTTARGKHTREKYVWKWPRFAHAVAAKYLLA